MIYELGEARINCVYTMAVQIETPSWLRNRQSIYRYHYPSSFALGSYGRGPEYYNTKIYFKCKNTMHRTLATSGHSHHSCGNHMNLRVCQPKSTTFSLTCTCGGDLAQGSLISQECGSAPLAWLSVSPLASRSRHCSISGFPGNIQLLYDASGRA